MAGKFGTNVDVEETPLGGPYLPRGCVHAPLMGPRWDYGEDVEGGITVDGEPVCPTVPYLRCVTVGICQGSCLGGLDPDEHCFLYGAADALGLLTYYGETVQFGRMTLGVGMVINGGGCSNMLLVYIPKGPTNLTDIVYCASKMVTLISVDNTYLVSDVALVLGLLIDP